MWSSIEGIVLSTTPLQSQHKILKVFSKEKGLLSFVAKYVHSKKKNWQMIVSPFSQSAFIYRPKNELHTLQDATLIHGHIHLRTDYAKIQAAGKMAHLLLSTHFQNDSLAPVYTLFNAYLKKLENFPTPELLAYSFLLKFLRLEGLFEIQQHCQHCSRKPEFIDEGQAVCTSHTKHFIFPFNQEELQQIFILSHAKQYSMMQPVHLTEEVKQKLEQLFLERTS